MKRKDACLAACIIAFACLLSVASFQGNVSQRVEKTIGNASIISISDTNSSIRVLSPTGSVSWIAGSSYVIKWTTTIQISRVDITLSGSSGNTTSITIIVSGTYDNGTYPWTIPSNLMAGIYMITVYETGDHTTLGTSGNFTIKAPYVSDYSFAYVLGGMGIGFLIGVVIYFLKRN